MAFPRISIVTCSYNTPLALWDRCLNALISQDYPKERIQHIVMDAGSTNGSIDLVRKYGSTVVLRKDLRNFSQKRMSIGIQKSRGDIVLFLEPDNIMPTNDWLSRMVEPFKDQTIIGAFSMHNTYTPEMSALSTYFALIGANDPILLYLGKSEKNVIYNNSYSLGKILYDTNRYTAVTFSPDTLPTLGDNGHMVRKKVIDLVNTDPNKFIHVDAFYQLAQRHHDTYGVVKNAIIHDNCQDNNIHTALSRRVAYKEKFYNNSTIRRSYLVFDLSRPTDVLRLVSFIVCSLTVMPMIIYSVVGYIRHRHPAWVFHPVVCFWEVILYGVSELRNVHYNKHYERFG